jgi:hypothetical protein
MNQMLLFGDSFGLDFNREIYIVTDEAYSLVTASGFQNESFVSVC